MREMVRGVVCLGLLLVVASVSACARSDFIVLSRLSVIELDSWHEDEDLYGVHVSAPDTVRAGHIAAVSIRTFGGGCMRTRGDPYTQISWIHGRKVVLMPFDQHTEKHPRSPLNLNCPDVLKSWTRIVPVTFESAGPGEILVEGISERRGPGEVIEVVLPIEVIP